MKKLYIATASWEPRFLEGARRTIKSHGCSDILCLWFEDYAARTEHTREAFASEFAHLKPTFEKLRLLSPCDESGRQTPSAQIAVWREVFRIISENIIGVDEFVFDITTTPREALWIILDLITETGTPGTIVYHRAESHGEWCAGEPERPHIVPKLGGVSALDHPTRLLVLTGFDEDRCEHFLAHFEPEETVIMLQEGSIEEDPEKNQKPHINLFKGREGVRLMSMNSYSADWGYSALEAPALQLAVGANLVLASLGPKTSAVALYKLHRLIGSSALVYSACKEYNEDYSAGIAETLQLEWRPAEILAHGKNHEVLAQGAMR